MARGAAGFDSSLLGSGLRGTQLDSVQLEARFEARLGLARLKTRLGSVLGSSAHLGSRNGPGSIVSLDSGLGTQSWLSSARG